MKYKFNKTANNFDILRLLAAISVVYTHSFDLTGNALDEPLRKYANYPFSFYGVRIFFTISGFLITKSLISSKSSFNYFLKRSLRIFPGLFVAITITIFLFGPLVTSYSLRDYFSSLDTYSYYSNVLIFKSQGSLPGFFKADNGTNLINGSLWTLSYEIFFYIALFIISKLGILKYRTFVLLSIILLIIFDLSLSRRGEYLQPLPLQMHEIFSLTEFSIYFGMGILYHRYEDTIIFEGKFIPIILILLAIFNVFAPIDASRIANYIAIPYLVFCTAYIPGTLNNFGKFGDYSYGFYIYSFALQQSMLQFIFPQNAYIFFLFSVLATFPFAYFSWNYVEERVMKLNKRRSHNYNLIADNPQKG